MDNASKATKKIAKSANAAQQLSQNSQLCAVLASLFLKSLSLEAEALHEVCCRLVWRSAFRYQQQSIKLFAQWIRTYVQGVVQRHFELT